jgi:hypothetical protein
VLRVLEIEFKLYDTPIAKTYSNDQVPGETCKPCLVSQQFLTKWKVADRLQK